MGGVGPVNRPVDPEGRAHSSLGAGTPVSEGSRAVLGFNGTAGSLNALAYAIGWAGRVRGHLDVLYVSGGCGERVIDACAATRPTGAVLEANVAMSEMVRCTVGDLLAAAGITWSYHAASGDVAHALERHADSIGADAVIVGRSHRHRRYSRSPSTVQRLLSCTRRIVIVIP